MPCALFTTTDQYSIPAEDPSVNLSLRSPNVVNKTLKIYNSSIRGTEAPLNYII